MKNPLGKLTSAVFTVLILVLALSTISCTAEEESGDTSEELAINNYLLTATGQTGLYDDNGDELAEITEGMPFYGQDGSYLTGEEISFKDNGDGTVSDLNSGLMWQQTPSSESYSWQEAQDYCDSLKLAGYSDWRAPSLKELFSISDFSSGWPYIDQTYFDLASGRLTKDEQFWSSNYYMAGTTHDGAPSAFGVNHVTGHIKAYPAEASGMFGNYVRAVRGGDYGANEFVNNADGTITDEASGLMWMQADNGAGVDWEHALEYAEYMEFAGYSDWRLPNVKELQSIVDYTRESFPAIDPFFACTQIVNEAGNSDYPYYWTGTSALFSSGNPYYYAWYVAFGRAVNEAGEDTHGAGAVRFDTKVKGGPLGEGGERYYNYVRLVRTVQ